MFLILSLPILDTLQKNNFFAGERRYSHQYQKTKGLKYPCKIDLVIWVESLNLNPRIGTLWEFNPMPSTTAG